MKEKLEARLKELKAGKGQLLADLDVTVVVSIMMNIAANQSRIDEIQRLLLEVNKDE